MAIVNIQDIFSNFSFSVKTLSLYAEGVQVVSHRWQGQVTINSCVELGSLLLQFNPGPIAITWSSDKLFDFALEGSHICKIGVLFETS